MSGVEQFDDVDAGDYGAGYIWCARALGLARGVGGDSFEPAGDLSREQMAAFLARLWRGALGRSCPARPEHGFGDVASSFAAADIACLQALLALRGELASYALGLMNSYRHDSHPVLELDDALTAVAQAMAEASDYLPLYDFVSALDARWAVWSVGGPDRLWEGYAAASANNPWSSSVLDRHARRRIAGTTRQQP